MSEMAFCRACGKELHRTAAACPQCGAARRTKRYKNKMVAAILAFFLGGLGVHRFYLGQWWGVFYLLFVWTWIPGLVALVEFFVFLLADQQKWDDKYNEGIPNETGGSGAVLAVVVGVAALFFLVAIVGILAAIAIPAYQDYTIRAQSSEAFAGTSGVLQAVAAARANNDDLQSVEALSSAAARGSRYLDYVRVAPSGVVTVGFNAAAASQIRDKTVVFEPRGSQGEVTWDCTGGTLASKFRPSSCRR